MHRAATCWSDYVVLASSHHQHQSMSPLQRIKAVIQCVWRRAPPFRGKVKSKSESGDVRRLEARL